MLQPLTFDVTRPLSNAEVQRNIDHACGLGLPEAITPRRLDIVANGPSAASAPFLDFEDTLALNGALALFQDWDLEPTMWAACDPQPLVADFLTWTPHDTDYLVCSQCHPTVFSLLRDRRVFPWHVRDETTIPPGLHIQQHGSSITLSALLMAPKLGYWDLHVWGWDCCILDGEHHAHGSALPRNMKLRPLEHRTSSDGPVLRTFTTTNTWAYEAQQAIFVIDHLRWLGCAVTVHGPGLVRHTLDFHASLEPAHAPAI